MRSVNFWISGSFFIIGIIICFENIMIPANGLMIGFQSMTGSVFFPLLIIMSIGIVSGFFAGLAAMSRKKQDPDNDDLDI